MNLRHLASWLCLIGTACAQDTQLTGFARTKELFEQGDPAAIFKVAEHHVAKNEFKTALGLYLPLAQAGNAEAQYIVGSWTLAGKKYARGDQQIPSNVQEGLAWLNLAAHQGHQKAMLSLGRCYRDGTGVSKDAAEAYKWLTLSRSNLDKIVDSTIGVSERENLAKEISVEDAREGQRRADAFRAIPKGAAQPIRADFLTLNLITGSTEEPVAMINGKRFTPGHTATLTRLGQPVEVTCAEINRQSVFVTFPPATNQFELRL